MSIDLRHEPRDSISSLCYAPSHGKSILAATSWDKTLRIYDVDANEQLHKFEFDMPLLDACFLGDSAKVVIGGLDKQVSLCDLQTEKVVSLGSHTGAVKHCRYHVPTNLVYTAGWDGIVKAWDPRMPQSAPICQAQLHGKAFAMDNSDTYLTVADSKKRTYVYDLRQGPQGLASPDFRDQILKYQIRCLRCFPNGTGFAAASIEGRVAWEYFDMNPEVQSKKYAFKCHRLKEGTGEVACPVNALSFHPQYGTFATGGSDGGVSVWDGQSKKRLWRLPAFPTSVAALAFNPSGNQLAIGVSYLYEKGPIPTAPAPQIVVRLVKDEDVRPKALQA
ncbi:mitotic checkpoint protein, BUB3 family protein [Toxoplasma gondii TgCatPRC2]|uniref:Mitotic checkpoint protein BUB3, putative n=15 Tax=Toxoplasma gondii TaxID=5811 RepID=B9PQ50_TOXGV|nr:mitotic checkpoint protein, BUB3 family protein [Toxoplasma gondii ME49]EPR63744.1 mitotic checkpoint protein, BUB3 family protein [Toxoplasma gondii GT1]ESS34050.1 mitotic checkpoint protein, BUB3 family protein [Toxoplasma gondii VEG]KAF4638399.1 mitotic checkpoint protein, BUB3 family protein [Toxoplasma gondii]KFG33865.1 mitotic checkpoint protein, BUB3 family protein [Toxoplasma gondii FOU]KFG47160.1 mitotic checkpoint protein, BUB3 family protein [Toxoplasma gondii GAB2-2007-GAL-DOM2]|eukprot:XP_002366977.1 mitotic checkpoint protein, BUB3 family protein [Toxoplasma gondii ME49]